jgi:predicted RNA-binding Zn ribbon-like protein
MSTPSTHEFVGGPACLDFANTVGPRRPEPGGEQRDDLPDYEALVAWARERGLPTAGRAADPAATHARALRLREAIHDAFAAAAEGRAMPPAALQVIQDVYVEALGNARLAAGPGRLDWAWSGPTAEEQPLWALARSAVDLATGGPLDRVKVCPGDDGQCGWLFLDTSKNGTRRWCSMRTCGSRSKSRRQVERLRAARGRTG